MVYRNIFSCPKSVLSKIKRRILQNENVKAVLVPAHIVIDPVTKKQIRVNITDRYFFIGTDIPVKNEQELNIDYSYVILLHNENEVLSTIKFEDIKKTINNHIRYRRDNIYPGVDVEITAGAFKHWLGKVEKKDLDRVLVNFKSDEYDYLAEMPSILCKTVT